MLVQVQLLVKLQFWGLYADAAKMSIHVQLQIDNEWQTIEEVHPRVANFHYEIVDLSDYVTIGEKLSVRLYWTDMHYLDFVGLDTSPEISIQTTELVPLQADHSSGLDVLNQVLNSDGTYAEIIPGEYITFFFDAPPLEEGMARDWILFVDGYYVLA